MGRKEDSYTAILGLRPFFFHCSKVLLFIPMMKHRYQRYGKQSYSADNSIYDTYLLPTSEIKIQQIPS